MSSTEEQSSQSNSLHSHSNCGLTSGFNSGFHESRKPPPSSLYLSRFHGASLGDLSDVTKSWEVHLAPFSIHRIKRSVKWSLPCVSPGLILPPSAVPSTSRPGSGLIPIRSPSRSSSHTVLEPILTEAGSLFIWATVTEHHRLGGL